MNRLALYFTGLVGIPIGTVMYSKWRYDKLELERQEIAKIKIESIRLNEYRKKYENLVNKDMNYENMCNILLKQTNPSDWYKMVTTNPDQFDRVNKCRYDVRVKFEEILSIMENYSLISEKILDYDMKQPIPIDNDSSTLINRYKTFYNNVKKFDEYVDDNYNDITMKSVFYDRDRFEKAVEAGARTL